MRTPTARLLVISHRRTEAAGGASARWRAMSRHLRELGWEVDAVTPRARPGANEFAIDRRGRLAVALRARAMKQLGGFAAPVARLFGVRTPPLSTMWIFRGVLSVRRQLRTRPPDVVVATGPPMVALLVARLSVRAGGPPLVLELRDLWAGNPAYDTGGGLLTKLEGLALNRARLVIVCTQEAADDLRKRRPETADRVRVVPNGYESELLELRTLSEEPTVPRVILHSGVLLPGRPLEPLLEALSLPHMRGRYRLVLQGHLSPETLTEVRAFQDACDVEVRAPSAWVAAIAAIASADVGLVTQASAVGDRTAVASKAYEYLALGKPVLCLSHGGATEAMLRRLGADRYCAQLDDAGSIERVLDRLDREVPVKPIAPDHLRPFDRALVARDMAALLEGIVRTPGPGWQSADGSL